jgi:hypothetical protein
VGRLNHLLCKQLNQAADYNSFAIVIEMAAVIAKSITEFIRVHGDVYTREPFCYLGLGRSY